MDRNEEERRERLKRNAGSGESRRPEDPRSDHPESSYSGDKNRSGEGEREKGTIDKLIDRAQEKGIFEKAEKFVRDRFGGGGGSGSSRRR